jgi:hypothetical protein
VKSSRPDGRGHWPAGRRRNADTGDWQVIRLGIQAMLREHHMHGVISIRAIGEQVGVSGRTVQKWLSGINRPGPRYQTLLRTS